MGEEFWKLVVGGILAYGGFVWGFLRWAISQHQAMRTEVTMKIEKLDDTLSREIEAANTVMNNRLLEVQRSVQSASDANRDRLDDCASGMRRELALKVDKDSFETVTGRMLELLDEQRDKLYQLISEHRRGN